MDGAVILRIIERAEQSCRYVLKHNEEARSLADREEDWFRGFEAACRICEEALRDHVISHQKDDGWSNIKLDS